VGGEREVEPQVVERSRGGLGGAGGEPLGRLGQRLALRRPLGALVAAPAANALARLREVGEVELHRAGADDVERVAGEDLLHEGGRLLLGPGLARPHARGRLAQPHHRAAQAVAALAGDRLLEQLGEQPGVAIEGRPGGGFGDHAPPSLAIAARQRITTGSDPSVLQQTRSVLPQGGLTP
jgi:hypothetical protein